MTISTRSPAIVTALLILVISGGIAQDLRIPAGEYATRRGAFLAMLDDASAAVLKSADMRMRSNDVEYRYRQESNFLYLTGLNQPGCFLLMLPAGMEVDGTRRTSILFVSDDARDVGKPEFIGRDDTVVSISRFESLFRKVLDHVQTLYVSAPDTRFVNDWLNGNAMFLDRDSRRTFEQAHPGVHVKNAGSFLSRLREIKSTAELGLIRRAIETTGDGLRRAMMACKPGAREYELQAEVEYGMTHGGAEYTSFPSIIGSGPNALILHYDRNRRTMQRGEVVVMDVGAEYNGYAADVTRTIPVSGRFTAGQKALYDVVLRAQQEVIRIIRAGVPMKALDARAREVIGAAGYAKYIQHSVSHELGLDVHDVRASDTLRAGMVITVEPGIYVPADDTSADTAVRGTGIRIEDDVEVTAEGAIVLSDMIPREAEKLERMMRRR